MVEAYKFKMIKKTEEIFWKFKTLIDLCYNKPKNALDINEILSIFMSNFNGKEIIDFRKAQTRDFRKAQTIINK